MRKIVLVFIIISSISCQPKSGGEHVHITDGYKPKLNSEAIYTKLNTINTIADSTERQDSVAKFFSVWHSSITPNTLDYINQNDTLSELYAVYKTIFKPFDLQALGNWEVKNDLYSSFSYIAIQNELLYAVVDSIKNANSFIPKSYDTLKNFRPQLDFGKSKVLYLTKEYEVALQNFLGLDTFYEKKYPISNVVPKSVDVSSKYELISRSMPVIHSSAAGFWLLETCPYIQSIGLNKTLDKAIVYFVVRHEGGRAFLVKKNGQWVIKESKVTWIE